MDDVFSFRIIKVNERVRIRSELLPEASEGRSFFLTRSVHEIV